MPAFAKEFATVSALVSCVGFSIILIYFSRKLFRARRRTEIKRGTVVHVASRGGIPSPDIEFFDRKGQKHRFKSSFGSGIKRFDVGSRVEVSYDPHDPKNCELSYSSLSSYFFVSYALGVTFVLVLGLFFTVFFVRAWLQMAWNW